MKLKDFEITDIFSYITIKDVNGNKLATICNDFEYGDHIPNYRCIVGDKRTELEKWNTYKDYDVLSIKNADIDQNWENNYVDIIINKGSGVDE